MTRATIVLLIALVAVASRAVAQPPCCAGSSCCGAPRPDPCLLTYGASGSVTDAVSGAPIAGATVSVLDLPAVVTGADGRFEVSGSRQETCNIDYYFSIRVTAPGYREYTDQLYTTNVLTSRAVRLEPLTATPTPTPESRDICIGDCNGDRRIGVHELITAVNVLLGNAPLTACASLDADDSGNASVDEVVRAVSSALSVDPLTLCYRVD